MEVWLILALIIAIAVATLWVLMRKRPGPPDSGASTGSTSGGTSSPINRPKK